MKRPFALIGFTYLTTLAVANFLGLNAAVMLCGIFAVAAVFSFLVPKLRRSKTIPTAAVCAFIAMLSYSLCTAYIYQPTLSLNGQTMHINAMVTDRIYNEQYDSEHFELSAAVPTQIGQQRIKLHLLSGDSSLNIGDIIEFDALFSLPKDSGGYSARAYHRSHGVFLYCKNTGEISVVSSKRGILYYSKLARERLCDSIDDLLSSETSAVIKGMVFGEDTGLSYKTSRSFSRSGISHLFAVSGLHISLLSGFLFMLLRHFRLKRQFSCIVVAFIVLCFMSLTGFSPSVTRAGIMCIVYCMGICFGRMPDPLNSLGLSVFIVALLNPFSGADTGLLLSFSATLGIILAKPYINSALSKTLGKRSLKPVRYIISAISTTTAAIAFTLPITMLSFGRISVIAPITNIICSVPAAVIFVCGFTAALINLIPVIHIIAMPFAFVAGVCSKAVLFISEKLSALPFAAFSVQDVYFRLWLCGTLLLIAAAVLIRRKKAIETAILLSIICLLGGVLSHSILYSGIYETAVINRQYSGNAILSGDGKTVVIGCGGGYDSFTEIEDYLDSRSKTKIDLLILPDTDKEYAEGAEKLMELFPTDNVIAGGGELYDEISAVCDVKNIDEYSESRIELGNNFFVDLYSNDGQSACVTICRDTCILFATKDMDMSCLPQGARTPDAAIYPQELPCNYQDITPACAVLCGNSKKSSQSMLRLRSLVDDCCLADDYGRLVIQTRGRHDITIRNEG